MKEIFGENGIISRIHERFEQRDEQVRMADFIMEILYEKKNGLIEAGTGVGKTLAYLIPSLIYCKENNKRLAVSTETKALQKQLIEKEIPAAMEALKQYSGQSFKYSLCLGSGNYPCRKRFEMMISQGNFQAGDASIIKTVSERFARGDIFTRFDVVAPNHLWEKFARESEICSLYKCPFSAGCVFQRTKKNWTESDLLVLNHYLFFANIAVGKTYLPDMDIVIFDEAHSLEEIASDQIGFGISRLQLSEIIGRFYKKNRKNSLMFHLTNDAFRKNAVAKLNKINKEAEIFFENLRGLFPPGKNNVKIEEPVKNGGKLIAELREFFKIVESMENEIDDEYLKTEYDILRVRLFNFIDNLNSAVCLENSEYVYWIEKDTEELLGDIELMGRPVDVSETIAREVSEFYDSALFVSATLTVNRDFSFMTKRLGITRSMSILLESPFNYKEQVVLFLNGTASEPDTLSFIDDSSRISAEVIKHLNGNCLILFTSYKMLEEVKMRLCELIDFPIYAQGDIKAAEAIDLYLKSKDAVLMGTHSFWQGIDLPGDLLRGLILMRLPFFVPDWPPVQARIERMSAQGQNPFYEYQIPNAIIKFKQGFGRLIRGKNDRGIVAVLDPRIITKNYGRLFLNSLPACKVVHTLEDMKASFRPNNRTD